VQARVAAADRLSERLIDVPGVGTPRVRPDDVCSYWRYTLRVDSSMIPGGPATLADRLKFYDIAAAPRYIVKPAFKCKVIADQVTFGSSRWPFTLARPEALDYSEERFPGTYAGLEQVLVFPWNERFTIEHADRLAESITEAMVELWAA
jgi:perosamine synthetase